MDMGGPNVGSFALPIKFDWNFLGRVLASQEMKLLLVGYGYLGEAIADRFREEGWEVVAVSFSGGADSIACDVSNSEAVNSLPDADAVVHCAASGRGGGVEAYRKVYVDGCSNLTARDPGVPLLYTSSSSVYGQTDGSVVTEDSPAEPDRETGQLLLEAEAVVLEAGGIVTRLSGIYGPGRSALDKLKAGTARRIVKPGQVFNRIHVEDIAAVLERAMTGKGTQNIYNLADDEPAPPQDVIAYGAGLLGLPVPPDIAFETARLSPMARSFYADNKRVRNDRIKTELGVELCYPDYKTGLKALLKAGY